MRDASPRSGRVLGLGDEVQHDVLVSPERGDVQRAPALAVGEPDIRPELHQQLDELQVSIDDRLVQRSLTLRSERVDVELTAAHVLQQGVQFLGVPSAHRLLENPLRRGACGHVRLAHGANLAHEDLPGLWATRCSRSSGDDDGDEGGVEKCDISLKDRTRDGSSDVSRDQQRVYTADFSRHY